MSGSPHKIVLLHILPLFLTLLLWGCQSGAESPPQGPLLELSLAVRTAPYSGLIAVADEKGYFKAAGLKVTLHPHPSGKSALEAVCNGEVQVATVADSAFAVKALEDPSIRILASIGTTVGDQIVARRDKNIRNPDDLKGKRIGVTPDTTSEYFLYTFLMTENIAQKDVTIVDIAAAQQAEALINGDVDAVSAFEVYAFEAKKRLGDDIVYWDNQNNLAYHWLLACRQHLTDTPEPLKRLLRALIKAENFMIGNEEETKRIILQKWGFELSPSKNRLSVSFGQSIITSLQNYSRWQLSKQGKPAGAANIMNYLHTGILDEVAPKLVSIYR